MKFHAIRENHLFVKAYRNGKKFTAHDLWVYVLPDRHAYLLKKQNPQKKKINRIGISTSKQVGGAVARSRTRRIIRAGFSKVLETYNIKTGYLIVISARPSAADSNSTTMASQLESAMKKLDMVISDVK